MPEVHNAYDYVRCFNDVHIDIIALTYTALHPWLLSLADTPTLQARTHSQQVSGAGPPF